MGLLGLIAAAKLPVVALLGLLLGLEVPAAAAGLVFNTSLSGSSPTRERSCTLASGTATRVALGGPLGTFNSLAPVPPLPLL